ncbi:class I SAM-dependent methyltransferase [Spirillospora sp. NPDC047279]|uniref:class I SAM-dependent methyltransferase n=1 Tax=Spirillospora sp. NPDC047279 TaxID=3155478 RepID=UPI0033C74ED3
MSSTGEGREQVCAMNSRTPQPRPDTVRGVPMHGVPAQRGPSRSGGAPLLDEIAGMLALRGCRSVLDVGCGEGDALARFAGRGLSCVGLDPSPTALRRASQRLGGRAFLLRGGLSDLRMFGESTLEAVTCFGGAGLVDDVERMLAEFQRVLRPEGVLVLTAPTTADRDYGRGMEVARHTFCYQGTFWRFYERDELRRLMADWRVESVRRRSWSEPVRDPRHQPRRARDSWVVLASNPFDD